MNNKSKSLNMELRVIRKEYVTPHYIRVYFSSERIGELAEVTVGIHNKLMIPPKGACSIVFPKYDRENHRWEPQAEETKCAVRTYTFRGVDQERGELWIDFVAHGDEGPASAWAISAQSGDVLGMSIRTGTAELFPEAENYLLVGDATALPVLAVILESLPKNASGRCIIEVHGPEDVQELSTQAAIEFIWLHNPAPHLGSGLSAAVRKVELPLSSKFAYVAAEFQAVKDIRQYLRKEQQWERDELDAYSYWKIGVAEDRSANERHSENARDSTS